MNDFFDILFRILSFAVIATAYWSLMRRVFPKYLLKVSGSADDLGRGIKRLRTESDRAVIYEPHPSVRKYLHQYALFTRSGFKNMVCNVDRSISEMKYVVQMFDAGGKLLDLLRVHDMPNKSGKTSELILHSDTSYVSVTVTEVNGEALAGAYTRYYRAIDILKYALAVFACNFITFALVFSVFASAIADLGAEHLRLTFNAGVFVMPSLIISVACALLYVWQGDREGIKVVLNDKKHR